MLIFFSNFEKIEKQLNKRNKDFENIYNRFVGNKLRIHFEENITISILFASKRKIKSAWKLKVKEKNIKIKQHLQVTYFGCVLNETLSGKPIALKALNKINGKLEFLYRKKPKKKIQIAQKTCIRFCLKLDKRHHISSKEFEPINWLPIYKRVDQWINAIKLKFVNVCPHYLNEVYDCASRCRIE